MWLERGRRGWGGFWRGCGRSLTLDEGHAELGTAGPTHFPMCTTTPTVGTRTAVSAAQVTCQQARF